MPAAFGDSAYDDKSAIADAVAHGRHRESIGGLWEEVGNLQFEFLASHGLEPAHHLLDIGCGSLRGGVRFAGYLEPGHYWGVDSNQSLLDAGYTIELAQAGLSDRVPRENLLCDDEFRFARFGRMFDVAIAQSLFTHLSANRIKLCLDQLATVMKPGGRLFATYFEVTDRHPFGQAYDHPHGVTTWAFKDPFHYPVSVFERLLDGQPWRLIWTGEWNHPRDQRMAIFERLPEALGTSPEVVTHALPPEQAASLGAGDAHYRAYVGPPDRFDFMSATQFALLFSLGLRDHQTVLDFGCGSLRLGRLLMPYLQVGRYFGIDPNRWLIHDALSRETGWSIVAVKKPTFAYNDDFRCDIFGRRFDFVVAQSIITHCGRSLTKRLLHQFAGTLASDGLALFSIIEAAPQEEETAAEGWVYPGCVQYRQSTIEAWGAEAGMAVVRLPWFHPGAVWYASALSPARLPAPSHMTALSGAVLFDPQFRASWPHRS